MDPRAQQRIGALMQRVLIADAHPASTKLLADLLRDVGPCQIWTAPDIPRALGLASAVEPFLILVGHSPELDGVALARLIRRGDLACRKAPIIMMASQATAAAILGARDAGVHEFLRRPFTMADLMRRIEAVAVRPRDWVEAVAYVGPDRRRFNSGDYSGPLKRRVDHAVTPDEARVAQALKIVRAALAAVETEPKQALRALRAQAHDLVGCGRAQTDRAFRAAVETFCAEVGALSEATLRRAAVEKIAAPLLALAPADSAHAA